MSAHDEMMSQFGVPMLMEHFGDGGRVVCVIPGDTPQRVPLDVAGVGPIQSNDEFHEYGGVTERRKLERVTISLKIESVTPAVFWKIVIDNDNDLPWTIDRVSTQANGAVNIHCMRAQRMGVARQGLEAR